MYWFDTYLYSILKITHIISLIFWLGPSLGAWWILRSTTHRFGEPSITSQFLYLAFLRITWIEHAALFMLISTGLALAFISNSYTEDWFILKALLITTIILPIELVDVWFCHIKLPGIFNLRHPSRPYADMEKSLLTLYHHRFIPLAIAIIPIVILTIFWLVFTKPGI